MSGKQAKILTQEHIGELLAYAVKTRYPERNRVIVLFSVKAGLRAGEIAKATWQMLLAADGSIGKSLELHDSAAKRGSGRRIPLHNDLRAVLKEAPKLSTSILTGTRNKPWSSYGFQTMWQRLLTKAGIEDLTFHDLRGSAVVRLALSGCTVPEIVSITGHSLRDAETILDKHYLGRDVKLAESAIRKLTRKERRTKAVNGL